uniref:Uncharacterized protein n=1 Tax=Cacopsylla melanoneura TaxID=428564 RepID=A0A8D9EXD7_9HEMI
MDSLGHSLANCQQNQCCQINSKQAHNSCSDIDISEDDEAILLCVNSPNNKILWCPFCLSAGAKRTIRSRVILRHRAKKSNKKGPILTFLGPTEIWVVQFLLNF